MGLREGKKQLSLSRTCCCCIQLSRRSNQVIIIIIVTANTSTVWWLLVNDKYNHYYYNYNYCSVSNFNSHRYYLSGKSSSMQVIARTRYVFSSYYNQQTINATQFNYFHDMRNRNQVEAEQSQAKRL